MRTVSWIILLIVTLLMLLGSAASLGIAYFGSSDADVITGTTKLSDLEISDDVALALRGRRGTAAALGLGYGLLLLFVVIGPYRQGAVWAWWAILCAGVAVGGGMLLRLVSLGIVQGATTGGAMLLVMIPALLLDIKRISGEAKGDDKPGDA